ncbi:MAG: hypothetical protein ACYS76_08330 [Planctomycetota bacterium]
MKSKMTKLATAATIIVVVGLAISLLDKSAAPAYGLEQTIKASHSVRYLHIKDFMTGEEEPKEFWVECDESGQVKRARLHIPAWCCPSEGAKVAVWEGNEADVWLKKKNMLVRLRDKDVADRMLKMIKECDPKLALERLYEQQEAGKVKIDIEEPDSRGEPVVVTATYSAESSTPGRRLVLFVDQATKLVTSIEFHHVRDGERCCVSVQEYYDYNIPIDSKMFGLEGDVPADVTRIDQVGQEVGLPQGTLSDEEVAVEVARQFFEALIAQDYAKAGRLFQGACFCGGGRARGALLH